MKKILVHICCAPDALYVMDLLKQDYWASGFFYNPNIQPLSEYELRLEETRKTASLVGFELIEGPCDTDRWMRMTEKLRDEPEKGRRCDICYAMRLALTGLTAAEQGFDLFTTVMSLSPWKKAEVMNRQGRMIGRRFGVEFLEANFKKKDGFRKSTEMSREKGLYRQSYCGCLYSLRKESVNQP